MTWVQWFTQDHHLISILLGLLIGELMIWLPATAICLCIIVTRRRG